MKECRIPGNTVLGEACRLIPGTGKESCYFWLDVEGESEKTVECLEPLVNRTLGCLFQQDVLERIKEKKTE